MELDLTKILKNYPVGTILYSTINGEVKLEGITTGNYPIIICRNNHSLSSVTKEGRNDINFPGECILFPSKDQRDWSKFKLPIDTPMMFKDQGDIYWKLGYQALGPNTVFESSKTSKEIDIYIKYDYCVPMASFDFSDPDSNMK